MTNDDVILRTTNRDPRVAPGIGAAAGLGRGAGATQFADSIRLRWLAFAPWIAPVDRDLVRQPRPGVPPAVAWHTHLNLLPRVELTLLRLTPPPGGEPGVQPPAYAGVERWRAIKDTFVTQISALDRVYLRSRDTFRLSERLTQERLSAVEHRVTKSVMNDTPPPRELLRHSARRGDDTDQPARDPVRVPPAEIVYRRENRPLDSVPEVREPGAPPLRKESRPPSPPAADRRDVDVDRLADHVIKVIDQRLFAQRERLGRI